METISRCVNSPVTSGSTESAAASIGLKPVSTCRLRFFPFFRLATAQKRILAASFSLVLSSKAITLAPLLLPTRHTRGNREKHAFLLSSTWIPSKPSDYGGAGPRLSLHSDIMRIVLMQRVFGWSTSHGRRLSVSPIHSRHSRCQIPDLAFVDRFENTPESRFCTQFTHKARRHQPP